MRTALFLSAICMFSVAAETQEMPLLLQEQHGSLDLPDFEFNLRPSSTQPEAWQLTDPFRLQAENAATSPLSPLPTIASPFSHANIFIFDRDPFAFDYSNSGMLYSWDSGFIAGFGARSTLPGLFSEQTAGVSASQQFGDFTLQGSVTANRYLLPRGIGNQFGIHGSASYRFSDHVSITLFGSYYNKNPFFSNAAQPYVGSSSYGGFFTFSGDRFGIDLGAERVYDPFLRQWRTAPIVTPHIRITDDFTLDLPVGWLIEGLLEKAFFDDRHVNPTIAPPIPPIPPVR